MRSRQLLFLAGAIFAVSFFLPAYSGSTGYACFNFCLELIPKFPTESLFKWLYYSAFVLTNITFVVMFGLWLLRVNRLKTRFIISSVAFFHVLSWFFINIRREDIGTLQVGYYLWLLAYALLLASQISEARADHKA
ncbi:MAG: hypothetical protein WC205_12355 [Opitutaceae bacterium]|jgi:hypothetical protein